jgi:hypothetical protein
MGVADDFLNGFFKQHPDAQSGKLSMEELNTLLAAYQQQMNDKPFEDFDGLSPTQMQILLDSPFASDSPFQLRKGWEKEVSQMPIFKLAEMLIEEIQAAGTLKLTATGNLPVRVCTLLCKQNLMGYEYLLSSDRIREDEVTYLWPLKQYVLDTGIVKKRNNTLSLTKQGEKFRGRSTPSVFYSTKLIQAFENRLWNAAEQNAEAVFDYHYAYASRFFKSFGKWFGLVEIEETKDYTQPMPLRLNVKKSALFDRLFQVR